MPVSTRCPARASFEQALSSTADTASIDELARHAEGCPSCSSVLDELLTKDEVSQAMSSAWQADEPQGTPLLLRLQNNLRDLFAGSPLGDTAPRAETLSPGAADMEERECLDLLAPAESNDEIGRLGGYRVLRILGAGGMGIVFLAQDPKLERPVALKVMRPKVASVPQSRQRFLREAKAVAALRHDNIVTIYQADEERGVPYLAMELLQGTTLDVRMKEGPPLDVPTIVRIGRQIAQGLEAMHARGLIHRDLKPGNVWLEAPSGRAKILDFGLVRWETAAEQSTVTGSGEIMGTPAYMSPEQARGDTLDPRSDLFSLGSVLYRLCTGKVPFDGPNAMAVLTALAVDTPRPIREVNPAIPAELAALIEKLLSKQAAGRPNSAADVARALAALQRTLPPPATAGDEDTAPWPLLASAGKPPAGRSRRWVAAAGFLAAAALIASIIVIIIKDKDGKEVARVTVPVSGSFEVRPTEPGPSKPELLPTPPVAVHTPTLPVGASPFDKLDPKKISEEKWKAAGGSETLKSKLVAFMGLKEFKDWTLIGEVAVSPTGKLLAVEGSKGRMNEHYVALIDVQRWEVLRTLGVPGGMNVQSIRALRFTPDEKTLIVLSWRSIHYFSVSSGQLLRSPPVPEGTGSGNLSFSPDGKTLASTGTKSAVVLFDIEGGQSRVLVKEVGWGTARFSHDGKLLLLAGQGPGRQFSVIDVDNGTERARLIIKGGDHGSISPDGKHLVVTITTPTDRTKSELELWDLTSSKRKDTWPLNLPDTVRTHVIYAPDGRHIILSNNAGVYVLRLASPPQPIPASTAFDALDPKTIAEKDWKAIGGSDVVKKRLVGYLPLEMFREWAWIGHIEPSPNGNLLAVSGAKGKENEFVALFDVRRWEVVRTMSVPTGPSAAIQALRFTPDEEMLLVRGLHKVHFFRVATGKLERTIDIPQEVRGLNTFSHDGKTLAQINKAGEIHLLDLQTEKTRFLVKIDDVSGMMMFSRDDTLLLIGSQTNGRQFTLVEVDKARVRSSFTVKGAEWGAFHPDGRSMAFIARATAISHILEFWDTALEQRSDMWRLDLPVTSRMRVTYAPEGRHVIVNDTSAAYILRLGTP